MPCDHLFGTYRKDSPEIARVKVVVCRAVKSFSCGPLHFIWEIPLNMTKGGLDGNDFRSGGYVKAKMDARAAGKAA